MPKSVQNIRPKRLNIREFATYEEALKNAREGEYLCTEIYNPEEDKYAYLSGKRWVNAVEFVLVDQPIMKDAVMKGLIVDEDEGVWANGEKGSELEQLYDVINDKPTNRGMKWEVDNLTLKEYSDYVLQVLEYEEFELQLDADGMFKLHDLQGANLGDIENERFSSVNEILDRLETYHSDHFFDNCYSSKEWEENLEPGDKLGAFVVYVDPKKLDKLSKDKNFRNLVKSLDSCNSQTFAAKNRATDVSKADDPAKEQRREAVKSRKRGIYGLD